ncbi:MAG: hypothetical protein ACTSRA_20060, partial [Promethearchaeota archaeon]
KEIKNIKEQFKQQVKDLGKFIDDLLKMRGANATTQKLINERIGIFEKFIDIMDEINKNVPVNELIKKTGIEFKLENESGVKNVKKFERVIMMIRESIAAQLLDCGLTLNYRTDERLDFVSKVCRIFKKILEDAKAEGFQQDYYEAFFNFSLAQYILILGIKKVMDYEYLTATKYFLKSNEIFNKIGNNIRNQKLIDEYINIAGAYASDSFEILYLLNSYQKWKNVLKTATGGEMKEIANASISYIEEWITKQYGFPPEKKIPQLLKGILWPRSMTPPEVKKI